MLPHFTQEVPTLAFSGTDVPRGTLSRSCTESWHCFHKRERTILGGTQIQQIIGERSRPQSPMFHLEHTRRLCESLSW